MFLVLDILLYLRYNLPKMAEETPQTGKPVEVASIKEAKTVPTLDKRTGLFAEVKIPNMHPVVRFLVIVLLALAGVCCFVSAAMIIFSLLLLMPAFLTGLTIMPHRAILVLADLIFAGLAYGILGILLPVFAYSIFRKKLLKRNHLVLAIIALVVAALCHFFVPILVQMLG